MNVKNRRLYWIALSRTLHLREAEHIRSESGQTRDQAAWGGLRETQYYLASGRYNLQTERGLRVASPCADLNGRIAPPPPCHELRRPCVLYLYQRRPRYCMRMEDQLALSGHALLGVG